MLLAAWYDTPLDSGPELQVWTVDPSCKQGRWTKAADIFLHTCAKMNLGQCVPNGTCPLDEQPWVAYSCHEHLVHGKPNHLARGTHAGDHPDLRWAAGYKLVFGGCYVGEPWEAQGQVKAGTFRLGGGGGGGFRCCSHRTPDGVYSGRRPLPSCWAWRRACGLTWPFWRSLP